MRIRSVVIAAALVMQVGLACSSSGSGKKCGSGVICGASDGGLDAGSLYTITTLNSNANNASYPFSVDLASDGRVGIAYFWDSDPALTDVELDYLELETDGSTQSTKIDTVQRVEGVSMVFDRGGTPQVAYLGHDPTQPFPLNDAGVVFWHQNNLAVGTVLTDGGVEHTYAADLTDDVDYAGDPNVRTEGDVVGLYPAMVALDAGLLISYRDIKFGQNPVGDFGDSNWDSAVGSPGNWVDIRIEHGDANPLITHGGLGTLAKMTIGSLGVGVICSGGGTTLGATAQDVFFSLYADGGWTDQSMAEMVNNVGPAGGSLAADPTGGFDLAWVEMQPASTTAGSAILNWSTSTDGRTWTNPEQVFGSGSGGWEPSLAYDGNGLPNVIYYVCSAEPGEGMCPASEQGLWLSTRRGATNWDAQIVDPGGGRLPNLHFDANGNLLAIYHDPASGALKMAVPTPQ